MVFLSGSESAGFFYRLFIYLLPFEIQLSRGGRGCGIPLTSLTPSQLCVCPKPGSNVRRHMSWSLFVFSEFS